MVFAASLAAFDIDVKVDEVEPRLGDACGAIGRPCCGDDGGIDPRDPRDADDAAIDALPTVAPDEARGLRSVARNSGFNAMSFTGNVAAATRAALEIGAIGAGKSKNLDGSNKIRECDAGGAPRVPLPLPPVPLILSRS
jgi:hypothetical protein